MARATWPGSAMPCGKSWNPASLPAVCWSWSESGSPLLCHLLMEDRRSLPDVKKSSGKLALCSLVVSLWNKQTCGQPVKQKILWSAYETKNVGQPIKQTCGQPVTKTNLQSACETNKRWSAYKINKLVASLWNKQTYGQPMKQTNVGQLMQQTNL